MSLYEVEFNKTFTLEGGVQRFKDLCKMFMYDHSMEMSNIVGVSGEVLHNKYGVSWEDIEAYEIQAITEEV